MRAPPAGTPRSAGAAPARGPASSGAHGAKASTVATAHTANAASIVRSIVWTGEMKATRRLLQEDVTQIFNHPKLHLFIRFDDAFRVVKLFVFKIPLRLIETQWRGRTQRERYTAWRRGGPHEPIRAEWYGAEKNGWQVAVAVAVAAIVLANYHDTSALLRRVAFTIGA